MTLSSHLSFIFFFFNDTATTEIYTLSLHDALPLASPALAPAGHINHAPCVRLPIPVGGLGAGRKDLERDTVVAVPHGADPPCLLVGCGLRTADGSRLRGAGVVPAGLARTGVSEPPAARRRGGDVASPQQRVACFQQDQDAFGVLCPRHTASIVRARRSQQPPEPGITHCGPLRSLASTGASQTARSLPSSLVVALTIERCDAVTQGEEIKALFLRNDYPTFPAFFDRAYRYAMSTGGRSWVARNGHGSVVGHLAAFPRVFRDGTRVVRAALLVDNLFDRAYRNYWSAVELCRRALADLREADAW